MRPGGHLATGVALGALAYLATDSAPLAAGCLTGAFLIDLDHYVDYLVTEGQWRRPGPLAFLRHAFGQGHRRLVLALHSWELVALLAMLCEIWPEPVLAGYVAGSLLHLALDVRFNGAVILRQPLAFYSFAYRAAYGFAAERLLAPVVRPPDAGRRPLRSFFGWRPLERPAAGRPAQVPGVPGALNPLAVRRYPNQGRRGG